MTEDEIFDEVIERLWDIANPPIYDRASPYEQAFDLWNWLTTEVDRRRLGIGHSRPRVLP